MKTVLHHCTILSLFLVFTEACAFGQATRSFEVDEPQYGQAFAGSILIDTNALGGFAHHSNLPKSNASALDFAEGDLYLFVDTTSHAVFKDEYKAHSVYLVNQGPIAHSFAAADSRIHLFAEVLVDGAWRSIERMPWIRCGNSYHQVFLDKDQYWVFQLPVYGGELPVKMRYRCLMNGTMEEDNEAHTIIYSNEFRAYIHPAQVLNSGEANAHN